MNDFFQTISKQANQLVFTLWGAVCAYLTPMLPFSIICTLLILADCYTAWELSRRVKKKYPGRAAGKFKSQAMGKVFVSMIKAFTAIILASLVENIIFEGSPVRLPNIVAGTICFWQVWSILENESSCNDAKWAKILQKIMIDKTERHFDIDLSELKEISGQKDAEIDEEAAKQGDSDTSKEKTKKDTTSHENQS
jgi:hypothetical protein